MTKRILHSLTLGVLVTLWVLAFELAFSRLLLPYPVRLDVRLVLFYLGLFGLISFAAGVGGGIFRRLGAGVPAVLIGACLAVLVLALRLHDLWDSDPSLIIGGALLLGAGLVASVVAAILSRLDERPRAAAPTVLLAGFVPVAILGGKLLVDTSPIALSHPIPTTLALVALWPVALAFLYRWAARRFDHAGLVKVAWAVPAVVIALCALGQSVGLTSHAALPPRGAPPADGPPIIWITVDTLRAENMSLHGYDVPTTPHLEELARTATLYTRALSQGPSTWQSVPSLLAGVTPYRHGGVTHTRRVREEERFISEILQERGYRTVAQSANPWVSPRYGMGQGFDEFRLYNTDSELFLYDLMKLAMRLVPWEVFRLREWLPPYAYVPITRLVNEAIDLVDDGASERPLFLYMQPIDPHGPYQPPLRYVHARDGSFTRRDYVSYWKLGPGKTVTPAQRENIIALYDGAITYADDELGRLFVELRERGIFDRAMIIVTSDHGEQFQDHGLWRHSNSLYQQLLHVPLIVKYPGQKEGEIVTDWVATFDIMPTILRQLGLPCADCEGQALQDLVPGSSRPILAYLMDREEVRPVLRGIVVDGWKYIHSTRKGVETEELYHVDTDPVDAHDQRQAHPEIAARLAQALASYEAAAGPPPVADSLTLPADEVGRLKALGYVQ
jgi:arylsulfatase A-like enzyme